MKKNFGKKSRAAVHLRSACGPSALSVIVLIVLVKFYVFVAGDPLLLLIQ
jgi:hypothetical protein